jgi:hypothetical protein
MGDTAFDGDERTRYVASPASGTERDGTLCVSCVSDEVPKLARTRLQGRAEICIQPYPWMESFHH